MIDLSQWREVSRRPMTTKEVVEYVEGNVVAEAGRSFHVVIHVKVKERIEIIYERVL